MPKPPNWCRDELLLALDFYFKNRESNFTPTDPGLIELADRIRALPIFSPSERPERFRNNNGVSMKLLNLRSADPDTVTIGLPAGGRLERELFRNYLGRQDELQSIADAILLDLFGVRTRTLLRDEDSSLFMEGILLYSAHRHYELDRTVASRSRTTEGMCHVCSQNSEICASGDMYVPIEIHDFNDPTAIHPELESDLKMVCSNCHRFLHRHRPWLSSSDARCLLAERGR